MDKSSTPETQTQSGLDADITLTQQTINHLMHERGLDACVDIKDVDGNTVTAIADDTDQHQIGKLIATGGMGAIFEAHDVNCRRTVAMKVMLPGKITNDSDLVRFIDEAQVTAQLEHPGIPPVHTIGIDKSGNVFYTMKFVKGRTLEDILEDIRADRKDVIAHYPLPRLLTMFLRTCEAISYAHARGVIHRDLKPENIMIGAYDEVQVMDWGLAKVVLGGGASLKRTVDQTVDGVTIGTPEYMAPEQAYGKISEMDERSDVYALGGILYTILTLRKPVSGNTMNEVLLSVVEGRIVSPQVYSDESLRAVALHKKGESAAGMQILSHCPHQEIHPRLTQVCTRALALRPDQRYQSAAELHDGVEDCRAVFGSELRETSVLEQLITLVTSHTMISSLIAVSFGVLFMLYLVALSIEQQELREAGADQVRIEASTMQLKKDRADLLAAAELKSAPRPVPARVEDTAPEKIWDAGHRIINEALATGPDALTYLDKGRMHLLWFELDEAEEAFKLAVNHAKAGDSVEAVAERYIAQLPEIRSRLENNNPVEAVSLGLAESVTVQAPVVAAPEITQDIDLSQRLTAAINSLARSNPGLALKRENFNFNTTFVQIDLSGPNLRTIAPLAGLPISQLFMFDSHVNDLRPLKGLPITNLNLRGSQYIGDIAPLRGMPITLLDLSKTRITDIRPLVGMPLRSLYLDGTRVSDISALAHLKELDTLGLSKTPVTDISALRGLPLISLTLSESRVTDIAPIAGMRLTALGLFDTSISDLRPLHGMRITSLYLNGSNVVDLSPLEGMPLEELNLQRMLISDISVVSGMPLKALFLDRCTELHDLRPLTRCTELENLTIPDHVKNIDFLRNLPKLKFLSTNSQRKPVDVFWRSR
ncbi:MAG: serine/threonine protein kinase [Rhodothermales bacterium]|jgi:serine/threonine protein kinase